MKSGSVTYTADPYEFIVPESTVRRLEEEKIRFEIISSKPTYQRLRHYDTGLIYVLVPEDRFDALTDLAARVRVARDQLEADRKAGGDPFHHVVQPGEIDFWDRWKEVVAALAATEG